MRDTGEYIYKDLYYIAKSTKHGYGVFAKEKIKNGTLIETPRYTILPHNVYRNKPVFTQDEMYILKKYNMLDFSCYTSELPIFINNAPSYLAIIPLTQLNLINWADTQEEINIAGSYCLGSHLISITSVKDIDKDEADLEQALSRVAVPKKKRRII